MSVLTTISILGVSLLTFLWAVMIIIRNHLTESEENAVMVSSDELNRLKEESKSRSVIISEKEREIRSMLRELEIVREENANYNKEVERVRSGMREIRDIRLEADEIKKKARAKMEAYEQLDAEHRQLLSENEKMKKEIDRLLKIKDESIEIQKRVLYLEGIKRDAQYMKTQLREMDNVKGQLSAMQNVKVEAEKLKGELKAFEALRIEALKVKKDSAKKSEILVRADQEMQTLRIENANLKKAIDDVQAKLNDQRRKTEKMAIEKEKASVQENNRLRQDLEAANFALENAKSEFSIVRAELERVESELGQAKKEASARLETIANRDIAIKDLEKKVMNLLNDMKDYEKRPKKEEHDELVQSIDTLKLMIKDKENESLHKDVSLSNREKELGLKESRIKSLRDENAKILEELEVLRRIIRKKEIESEEQNKVASAKNERIEDLLGQIADEDMEHDRIEKELRKMLEKAQDDALGSKTEIDRLERELEKVSKDDDDKTRRLTLFKEQMESMDSERQRIMELEKEFNDRMKGFDLVIDDFKARLKSSEAEAKRYKEELDDLTADLWRREGQKEDIIREFEEIKKNFEDKERSYINELGDLRIKTKQLSAELEAIRPDYENIRGTFDERDREIKVLNDKLDRLHEYQVQQEKEFTRANEKMSNEADRAKKDADFARSQLIDKAREASEKEDAINRLNEELVLAQKNISEMEKKIAVAEARSQKEVGEVKVEIDKLSALLSQAEERSKAKDEEMMNVKKKYEKLAAEKKDNLKGTAVAMANLKQEMEKVRKEYDALKTKLDEKEKELEIKKEETEAISQKLLDKESERELFAEGMDIEQIEPEVESLEKMLNRQKRFSLDMQRLLDENRSRLNILNEKTRENIELIASFAGSDEFDKIQKAVFSSDTAQESNEHVSQLRAQEEELKKQFMDDE